MTLNIFSDETDTDEITVDKTAQGETDPIQASLLQQYDSRRSQNRNRRRGFTPSRRGRPRRTVSGGSY